MRIEVFLKLLGDDDSVLLKCHASFVLSSKRRERVAVNSQQVESDEKLRECG